jgi:hypothetical protein
MHHTKVFIAVYNTAVNKLEKIKQFVIKSGNK